MDHRTLNPAEKPAPFRTPVAVGVGLALTLVATAPFAQPGTSGQVANAAVDALGGRVESENARVLGFNFDWLFDEFRGVQLDVAGGDAADETVLGLGGHLFWNDPAKGVLDFNVAHVNWGNVSLSRIGLIGKWYSPITTFTGRLEYQDADELDGGFLAGIDARWYPTSQFMVKAGAQDADGESQLNLGFEFLPNWVPVPGMSFVGEAARGEGGYDQFFLGVRYYFGTGKTLKDRHRQDVPLDPPSEWLTNDLQSLDKARKLEKNPCPYPPNSDLYYICVPESFIGTAG